VTDFRVALLELLCKYQGDAEADVLREGIKFLAEALMELEVSEQIGAGRYERSATRKTYRNGYRDRIQKRLRFYVRRQKKYLPIWTSRRNTGQGYILPTPWSD
jgi:transposase-like protein